MSIAIGDICTLARRQGLWAVMEYVPGPTHPPAERWRVIRDNGPSTNWSSFVVGTGDLFVLGTPAFEPGQKLTYQSRPATVVQDNGGTVRLYIAGRKELEGGGFIDISGETEAGRAAVVAENATHLLKLLEQSN